MDNLQKLYQVLKETGLITSSYADFARNMSDDSYKQKVFKTVSDRRLFTQDYNSFNSTYSPKKVKIFGKEKDPDNLTYFESLAVSMKNLKPEISKAIDWYSAYTVDVGMDLTNFILGDAFSLTPEKLVDQEFGGDFKLALDKSSDKKFAEIKNIYFIDPLTNNKVVFDKKAFKSKGHYAEENERWYELARLTEKSDDIESGFIDSDANARKADMAMPVVKRALETEKEIQEFTSRDTTGFTDAMKKGETKDASLYAIDFAKQMLKSIVLAKLTKGSSLYAEAISSTYQGFNLEKANALYGGRDEESVRKLMANGESEVLIPTAAAGFVAALDKLGLDGLSGKYFKNILAHRKALTLLVGSGTEGATEYTQGLIERFNNNLGAQMSVKEAAEDVAEYAGSDEALDQFFAGLIGGGMIQGAGITYNAAFRRDEASIDFIDRKINNINKLQEEAYKSQDPEVIKANKAKVDQEFKELKLYLKRNKDASEFLTDKGKKEIIDLANSRESVQKKIKELNNLKKKGAITKEAAEVRLNQYQSQLKEINSKTTEIRNEAVKAKLQADLKASGFAVENIDELNQVVVKNGKELFERVGEWYKRHGLENPYTQEEFETESGGDALILGNNIFINEKNAVKNSAFGVGTHEFLHAVIKSVIRKKDGSGELSDKGVALVKDFLNTLSTSDRIKVEKRMKDEYEEGLSDEQNFRKYGEEAIAYYVQLKKEKRLTKSAAQRGMVWLKNSFSKETPYKNLDITDGKSFQNFLDIFVSDAEQGQFRSEFVALAKQGAEETVVETKAAASKTTRRAKRSRTVTERQITEKAKAAQGKIDEIGKKATSKAEYDAGVNIEAYNYLINGDGLTGLIKARLAKQGIDTEGEGANVNGVPMADYIEDVKAKLIPDVLGFNPEKETTSQGKFGLSGYINQRLGYRMGDVSKVAKKTVTGRSLDAPIDDSGRTAAELVEGETDSRLAKLEEENLGFLYVNSERRALETQEESNENKSRYRHKLKNFDGSKLIGETQVESVREGVRTALVRLFKGDLADKFLLNFENMVKKTMKNIVQRSIGSGASYRQFVLNNFEAIIDFSTVQDLVAMERLVGKGKLKDGKKIFTVPIRRLTKQEDIQKAIDQGKLPVDAINKSEEGVFLSEKRMPTQEELQAFFFGVDMQEVLGYELGASTLGTRKDGLSRMIVTELAQDATMETLQEPAIMQEILSLNPELYSEIIVQDVANKINRSPSLKFSKTTKTQITSGNFILANNGVNSNSFKAWVAKSEDEAIYQVLNKFFNKRFYDYRSVRKLVGQEKIKKIRSRFPTVDGKEIDVWKVFEIIAIEEVGKALKNIDGYNLTYTKPTEEGLGLDVSITGPKGKIIGIEIKGTTAQTSSTDMSIGINSKGEFFAKLPAKKELTFFEDKKDSKDPLRVYKALQEQMIDFVNEIKDFIEKNNLGELQQTAQGNVILTKEQLKNVELRKLIKKLKTKNYKKTPLYVSTQVIVDQYNGKGSQYINMGLSGFKMLGKENPLLMDKNVVQDLADLDVKILMTQRMILQGNGRITFKVFGRLDSRDFPVSDINLFNKDGAAQLADNTELNPNSKLNTAENIVKASDQARTKAYFSKTKGASIFDFDETVGVSENFVIATKGKKTVKISSEQWPVVGEDYMAAGYEFDFTDFNRVTKGKPGPLLPKMKNQIKKYGPDNVFILTARAPESAVAIHDWLKSEGINIPLKNITGLGNSTGEAKAMWVLDKYANEGYNDMYFVDDAITNVQAVQNIFDQLDIKGKSVQAKIKFSKTKKQNFDSILKRTVGIDQDIDPARAKIIGAKKGKREFFIAPGADDFQGLMMRLAGKGEQGESDMKFFKQVFFDPFNRAYRKLNSIQYNMMEGYNKVRKEHKGVIKILKKKFDSEFTNEDAIRIYLWDLQDIEVPGLTTKEQKAIAAKVAENADMVSFALDIRETLQLSGEYVAPKETWSVGSIKGDMYEALNSVHRNKALQEWQENIDELLDNPEMLAKLEASMGKSYVEALKDMLYRMRTGKNRPTGPNAMANKAMNWLQGAVGAIMFFNSRSAVLQTISTINFINHTDNNIFAFAKAIANVSQFAEDFKMLFNSPQLKVRRSGLQQDIQTADLADSLSRGGGASGALAYLLKIGFLPTQIADSFAIAFGGAAFYRNRVNSLMKQGMTQEQAESQAMIDFQDITEESQQSSRPDRISQQQAAPVGRLLLAFQNTPLQYNRIIKKAITDIANKRGDIKTHISRIAYYGAIQSLIFYTLQQALFAEDDPEEEEVPGSVKREYNAGIKDGTINKFKYPSVTFYYRDTKAKQKQESLVNSMADGWLRGSGVKGAIVSTFKNVVRSFMKESEKGYKADYFNTFIEVLNVSPQIGSKARKIKRASDTYKYNKEVMSEISAFDIDNPVYPMAFSLIEGVTNAPTHRIYTKLDNLKEAFNEDNTAMQRTFVSLGWNQWQLGIDTYKDVREAKEKIKEREKAKKKQCRRILKSGKRCSIRTTSKSQLCYHHD
tara:strand:- start:1721 stop:9226 length:7506 start_codon:yes stop_codon:yes gene_type:complete